MDVEFEYTNYRIYSLELMDLYTSNQKPRQMKNAQFGML